MILNQYHVPVKKKKKNDYVIELVFTGHMPKCGVSFFFNFSWKVLCKLGYVHFVVINLWKKQ